MKTTLKKHWLIVGMCLLLCLFSAPAVLAVGITPLVNDQAGILTAEEQQSLNQAAEEISDKYNCGICIYTVENFTTFGYSSIYDFAADYVDTVAAGYGGNGQALVLSMADRDYAVVAAGQTAHTAFTDYGKEKMSENYLDNFRNNDWAGGFRDYISDSGTYLKAAADGKPVDVGSSRGMNPMKALISLVVSGISALTGCNIMKSGMKSVRNRIETGNYTAAEGLQLHVNMDRFINETESRRFISTGGPSRGGFRGGTTIDAGGHSGHSGKF
nr:TPM domain-containing protein [uncultured Shuttleworthia sp.]